MGWFSLWLVDFCCPRSAGAFVRADRRCFFFLYSSDSPAFFLFLAARALLDCGVALTCGGARVLPLGFLLAENSFFFHHSVFRPSFSMAGTSSPPPLRRFSHRRFGRIDVSGAIFVLICSWRLGPLDSFFCRSARMRRLPPDIGALFFTAPMAQLISSLAIFLEYSL